MLLAEGIRQQLAILKLHVSKTNINWWWYDESWWSWYDCYHFIVLFKCSTTGPKPKT